MPDNRIVAEKVFLTESEPSGMTGDQHVFGLWILKGSESEVSLATSNARVSQKLYWLQGQSDQLDRAVKFFKAYDEFRMLLSTNTDVLEDQDIRYSYVELSTSESDKSVEYAAMWICSPRTKKLLFLSGH